MTNTTKFDIFTEPTNEISKFLEMKTYKVGTILSMTVLALLVIISGFSFVFADWGSTVGLLVKVTDSSNGSGAVGVDLLLVADERTNPSHGLHGITGSDGTYLFDEVNIGSYNFEMRSYDYQGQDFHIDLNGKMVFEVALNRINTTPSPTPVPTSNPPPTYDCNNPGAYLSGSITNNGESNFLATGTINNNSNCTFQVGFASYKMFHWGPDPREDQVLFDSTVVNVGPFRTVDLSVRIPDCRYQIDLFWGGVRVPPYYEGVALDYDFGHSNVCVVRASAPVPTPYPTSTPYPTPTPYPVPTPYPTPTPCVSGTLIVNSNSYGVSYSIYGPNGTINSSGSQTFNYQPLGNYSINITNNNGNTTVSPSSNYLICNGVVVFNITTNTSPTTIYSNLEIQKFGRNISRGESVNSTSISASSNQTIEFHILVSANSSVTINNVIVTDALPFGLTYVNNSTSLNGNLMNNGITGSGINIGSLNPGQQVLVRFLATVDPIAGGQSRTMTNISQVRSDNLGAINSNPVNINVSQGIVLGALSVRTGASSALFISLIIGLLSTLGFYWYKAKLI